MRRLSKCKAGWLELRKRLALWIDPFDWDELLKPEARVEMAEREIGLWLAAADYEELEAAAAEGPIELTPEQQASGDAFRDELLAVISRHRAQRIGERRIRRLRRVALVIPGILLGLVAANTTVGGLIDTLLGTSDRGLERRTDAAFESDRYVHASLSKEPKLANAHRGAGSALEG